MEWKRPLTKQEEEVSALLCYLDTQRVGMGLCGIHLRILRESGQELIKTLFIISPG